MVHLSELLGLPAYDTGEMKLGKISDLHVDPSSGLVRCAVIRNNGRILDYAWSSMRRFSPANRRVVFDSAAEPQKVPHPQGELISLSTEVLDRQIIDIAGRKVVRVNDVLLEMLDGDLVLRSVEVGLAGAMRRLMAGLLPPRLVHALAGGLSDRGISWEYVGLVEPDSAQIRLKVHQQLARLHPADVADIIEDLGRVERKELVSILGTETAAQALSEVESSVQATVVEDMKVEDAADLLEEMAPDEAADILGDLPDERSEALLDAMEHEEAEDVKELLNFDEDTAGGLMTTEFFKADPGWTVGFTLQALRESDADLLGEMDEIPLMDKAGRLVGIVPLVRLVRRAPEEPVASAMRSDARSVQPDMPLDEVAERFAKYHLRGLAVADEFGHLVGLITIEDLLSRLTKKG
jgi:magnesium transporter